MWAWTGERDPLKGWARKDAALGDPFSVEHPGVDVMAHGLKLDQVL